jgi:regulator of protease activity HflC (stomatin/prohibitin superfamily)
MIGIITFVLSVLVLGTLLGIFNLKNYFGEADRYGDKPVKAISIIKLVSVVLLSVIIAFVNPISVERIDTGYVGIKVDNVGDNKGNSRIEYTRGWVFYNSWLSRIYEFPIHQQHIDYEENIVITKGGFQATIKPSFNYSINPGNVDNMFQNLRVGVKEMEQGWLKNAIISSVNDVANLFTVDSIFNHRAEFEAAIISECNKRVSKWFTVSQLRTNIVPPPAITKAIEEKTKAVQEAQAAYQRKLVAEAEAQEKMAIARGDSAKAVITAAGQAQSNKLLQQSLTQELVQKMWIEKWNGALPTYQLGSGNGVMLNLPNK